MTLRSRRSSPEARQAPCVSRPLDPGKYPFIGEYHEDTAKGVIVAE